MRHYFKMLKQIPNQLFKSYNRIYNFFILKIFQAEFNNMPKINGRLFIRNYGTLILNKNINFNSGPSANPMGGDTRMTIVVFSDAYLEIGEGSAISNSSIICKKKIVIGKDVYIGASCRIYDTDFHSLNYEERVQKPEKNISSKPVEIKTGVFIGAHTMILKGVTIGEKSIIGAGSVVTKNIPANQIWAGNPAKFIRNIEKEK